MEVVEELLEGGADPNQADEVRSRATLSHVCHTVCDKVLLCRRTRLHCTGLVDKDTTRW